MKQQRLKIASITITAVIITALLLALSLHYSSAPAKPTVKVEYIEVLKRSGGTYMLVNFDFKITLQNIKEAQIDLINFALNGVHSYDTFSHYPYTLEADKENLCHMSFAIPTNTTEYAFTYNGLEEYTFVFTQGQA